MIMQLEAKHELSKNRIKESRKKLERLITNSASRALVTFGERSLVMRWLYLRADCIRTSI